MIGSSLSHEIDSSVLLWTASFTIYQFFEYPHCYCRSVFP